MSNLISKWCDVICHNKDEMHLGSYRTFKMIKDEANRLTADLAAANSELARYRQGVEVGGIVEDGPFLTSCGDLQLDEYLPAKMIGQRVKVLVMPEGGKAQ